MPPAPDVVAAIVGMALLTYACRAAGFWAMGFVPLTPRVRAWLESVPVAVMTAIVVSAGAHGGVPEWIGLAVALAAMRTSGNELVGMLAGVVAVALARAGDVMSTVLGHPDLVTEGSRRASMLQGPGPAADK